VQLYRAHEARQRLREALALHESTQTAVVLVEADDRVAFASTAARELPDRYFGENEVRLPDAVASWLRERRRRATGEPLRIDAGGRALVVELVDGALLSRRATMDASAHTARAGDPGSRSRRQDER
jgi:hypothetical protein